MSFAGRMLAAFAIAIAGLFLLVPADSSSAEEICNEARLQPLHCVSGTVVNKLREPVVRATVTIFKDGAARASVKTGADGKFAFEMLEAANHEIQVQAEGFRTFKFPVTVAKPDSKCKRALEIELTTGSPENCSSVRIVKQ